MSHDAEIYDISQLSPVFYGYNYEEKCLGRFEENVNSSKENESENEQVQQNSKCPNVEDTFKPEISHLACCGFKLIKKTAENFKEEKIDFKIEKNESTNTLPAKIYLEKEVFPTLLPAIEAMLQSAKDNNVLKWKRTKFNACDYLTEYLYNNNPRHGNRERLGLWDIPFVQRINEIKPRPPLPLSLLWTEDEAAIILQSCWRGRKVRSDPEVQELRQYQKEMREQEYDIMLKIEDFWKKHPVEDENEVVAEEEAVTTS
eukprot:gene9055-10022_t